MNRASTALAVVLLTLTAAFSAHASPDAVVVSERLIVSNDAFIAGLYTNLDLDDPSSVFRYVYRRIPGQVSVYPSEGYYYWQFPARGLVIRGCFTLQAKSRDLGEMGFGFVGCVSDPNGAAPSYGASGSLDLKRDEGVRLDRIDEWTYRARFEGKSVTFHLIDPGLDPPAPDRIHPDEEYVGTSFDESGLRFHLLFNRRIERMYWMLADEEFFPEVLALVSENLVLGERTRFVFYADRAFRRRILVGVQGDNVRWNSWYDGPFDQLPDTHVKAGRIDLRRYLVAHAGLGPEAIDEYGYYPDRDGVRIALTPYTIYNDLEDLSFVDDVVDSGATGSELYERITREVYLPPRSALAAVASE